MKNLFITIYIIKQITLDMAYLQMHGNWKYYILIV